MRSKQQEAVDGLAVVVASIPRNEDTVSVVSIAIREYRQSWLVQQTRLWPASACYRRSRPILTFARSQQMIAAPRLGRNVVRPSPVRVFAREIDFPAAPGFCADQQTLSRANIIKEFRRKVVI